MEMFIGTGFLITCIATVCILFGYIVWEAVRDFPEVQNVIDKLQKLPKVGQNCHKCRSGSIICTEGPSTFVFECTYCSYIRVYDKKR